MQVILLENVPSLGKAGDLVTGRKWHRQECLCHIQKQVTP